LLDSLLQEIHLVERVDAGSTRISKITKKNEISEAIHGCC